MQLKYIENYQLFDITMNLSILCEGDQDIFCFYHNRQVIIHCTFLYLKIKQSEKELKKITSTPFSSTEDPDSYVQVNILQCFITYPKSSGIKKQQLI